MHETETSLQTLKHTSFFRHAALQHNLLPDLGSSMRMVLQKRFFSESSRKHWIKAASNLQVFPYFLFTHAHTLTLTLNTKKQTHRPGAGHERHGADPESESSSTEYHNAQPSAQLDSSSSSQCQCQQALGMGPYAFSHPSARQPPLHEAVQAPRGSKCASIHQPAATTAASSTDAAPFPCLRMR